MRIPAPRILGFAVLPLWLWWPALRNSGSSTEKGDLASALPRNSISRLKSKAPLKQLRHLADDPSVPPEKRAKAIFTMFARFLRPPQTAASLHRILGKAKWLKKATVYRVWTIRALVPIEMTLESTVFMILPFPKPKAASDWVLYMRLSGGEERSAKEARAFLQGCKRLKGKPRLDEFALSFPDGRVERFTLKGLIIYPPTIAQEGE
jgi:hypothetical protein